MANLQVDGRLNAVAQVVKDQNGNASSLALSTDRVGIGTSAPTATLNVDPRGAGGVVIGNPDTGQGGFTSLLMNISAEQGGFATIQAIERSGTAWGNIALNPQGGNVGIATTAPQRALQFGSSIDAMFTIEPSNGSPNAGFIRFGDNTGWRLHFGRSRESSGSLGAPLNTGHTGVLMTIQDNGSVGIGTAVPQERLHVDGNILATGDILLPGADCAEEFDVEDAPSLAPGTVVVIGDGEKLRRCTRGYDKRVAGVLSGAGSCRAGIILGRQPSSSPRLPLALTGKVFCMVDADHGSIDTGDLLTTSPTPGHAMKAADPSKAFGAVIGKALRPLATGRDLVPILITLQ